MSLPLLPPQASPAPFSVSSKNSTPSRLHLDYLDGLRALAALFVLLHHSYLLVWNIFLHRYPAGPLDLFTRWILYGHFAVSLFIVISGFSLMLPIARGDGSLRGGAKEFFKRRARRILPPYYIAMALALLICVLRVEFGGEPKYAVTTKDVVSHLFLLHNLSLQTIGSINGAFWSIAVECQIYLLFPLLIWLCKRIGMKKTALLAIAAGFALNLLLQKTPWIGLTPHYLALFVLGMLGAKIAYAPEESWKRLRNRLPWGGVLAGLSLLLVFWCWKWGWELALSSLQPLSDLLAGLCALSLLVAASRPAPNRIQAALAWRPLAWLGTFAYSLYLIHIPLLHLIFRYGIQPLSRQENVVFALLLCIGMPVILSVAYLFFLACERPFLNTRR